MLSKEQKIKLILLSKKAIITSEQLKAVIKFGFPAPAIMLTDTPTDRDKELLSVEWIYKLFGEPILKITFGND